MTKIGGIGLGAGAAATLAILAIGFAMLSRGPSDVTDPTASIAVVSDRSPQMDAPDATVIANPSDASPATVEDGPTARPQDMPTAPDFDVVRVDPAGSALVAGRAAPEQDVTLRIDGEPVATVKTDAQGNFVSFFDVPRSDVPQVLSLETAGADGLVQKASDSVIVAPTVPPAPSLATEPTIATALAPATERDAEPAIPDSTPDAAETPPGQPDASDPVDRIETPVQTAATTPPAAAPPRLLRTGPDGLAVLQGQEPVPDAQTDLGIDAITYDSDGDVQLAGRAADAAELRIYLDNRPIGDVQADPSGAWASQLTDVPPGVYTLRVDEVQANGGVSSRIETPFERAEPDLAATLAGNAEAITVQPGFTLWAISESLFGEGVQYVQIFEANRDVIRDPDLIYPGQVFALPDPG
ncbi:MAG: LysM peptidoglycan-binding domain-containing protein [Pseudomonadota bacterium]